ncbi:MAG: FAD-dependent oxidoreductase, partial [Bacteroidetes bacterium]|nr:FAD-dependent oxidoreductase [Bacteroidota bacterium]
MSSERKVHKCIIVGSGPAGYTAAIYAARADMQPIMYTGMEPGGQLMQTTEVDNFPGYPNGVGGPAMMEEFKAQAERFDTEVRIGYITEVDFTGPIHRLQVDGKDWVEAHTVIISTGASAK